MAPAKPKKPAAKVYGKRDDLGAPIDGYLAKLGPSERATADALVALIAKVAPMAKPALKWGFPVFSTASGIVCYVRGAKGYVRFGFGQTAGLEDVRIASAGEIDKAALTRSIKAALAAVGK